MKRHNRFLSLVLALMLAVSVLSAMPAAVAEGETVTVNIAWENTTDDAVDRWHTYFIEPFEAANPNIKINFEVIPDITTVIKVQLAAGTGPDVFSADNVDIMEYWNSGTVASWDKYLEQGYFADVFDWAKDACQMEGQLAAIPMSYEGMMLWYNEDMMQQHGWSFPTNLEEYEQICADALAADIVPIAHGCNNSKGRNAYMHIMGDYLNAYAGPEAFKAWMSGEVDYTDPRITGAFQLFVDHWNNGWVNEKQTVSLDMNSALALWYQQMALFQVQGSWYVGSINSTEIDFNYSMGYFPSLKEGIEPNMNIGIGEVVMMNKDAAHPDEAAMFFNSIYTDEANLTAAIANGQQILSRAFDANKLPESVNPHIVELYNFMSEASSENKIGYTIWTFVPGTVAYSLYSDIETVLLGEGTLEDYLKNLQALLDEAIAAGWKFAL